MSSAEWMVFGLATYLGVEKVDVRAYYLAFQLAARKG